MSNITLYSILKDIFKSDSSVKDKIKELGLVLLLILVYYIPHMVVLGVLVLIYTIHI